VQADGKHIAEAPRVVHVGMAPGGHASQKTDGFRMAPAAMHHKKRMDSEWLRRPCITKNKWLQAAMHHKKRMDSEWLRRPCITKNKWLRRPCNTKTEWIPNAGGGHALQNEWLQAAMHYGFRMAPRPCATKRIAPGGHALKTNDSSRQFFFHSAASESAGLAGGTLRMPKGPAAQPAMHYKTYGSTGAQPTGLQLAPSPQLA